MLLLLVHRSTRNFLSTTIKKVTSTLASSMGQFSKLTEFNLCVTAALFIILFLNFLLNYVIFY